MIYSLYKVVKEVMRKYIHAHGTYESTVDVAGQFDLRYMENGRYYRYNEDSGFSEESPGNDWVIVENFNPEWLASGHREYYYKVVKAKFYEELLNEIIC
jgi:hypothetical protein